MAFDLVDINGNSIEENLIADTTDPGLMDEADKVKLNGIETGAQVNKINTVDTAQFAITSKKLTLLDINISKIVGLSDILTNKVDIEEGKGLSTNDLTNELMQKLEPASATTLGVVQIGKGISVNSEGVISVSDNEHTHNIVDINGLQTSLNNLVPKTRTINNKALSANISLTAADVGASPTNHTHSYLPLTGGTVTGPTIFKSTVTIGSAKLTYNATENALIIS